MAGTAQSSVQTDESYRWYYNKKTWDWIGGEICYVTRWAHTDQLSSARNRREKEKRQEETAAWQRDTFTHSDDILPTFSGSVSICVCLKSSGECSGQKKRNADL